VRVSAGLVDIFDGGPTVTCRRDQIASLRDCRMLAARIGPAAGGDARLISTDTIRGFRAVAAPVVVTSGDAVIDPATARALDVEDGMEIGVR